MPKNNRAGMTRTPHRRRISPPEQSGPHAAYTFEQLKRLTEEIKTRTMLGHFEFGPADATGRRGKTLLESATELFDVLELLRKRRESRLQIHDDRDWNVGYKLDYLQACCWAAEVFAYFGRNDKLRMIVEEEGPIVFARLLASPKPPPEQRVFVRQRIWFALYYAYCLYRQHEYYKVQRVVNACQEFAEALRDDKSFPLYFTRARLLYCQGQIHRQLSRLDMAQSCYQSSIELIYRRLNDQKKLHGDDQKRIAQEEARANYEIAKCLALGVGWIQYTQGLLDEARANVLAASVILSPIPDPIHKAYAQLLYGCIERASAGFNREGLQKAIDDSEKAYRKFADYGHLTYGSRASHELSLAYLYRGKAEEEIRNTEQAERYYSRSEDKIKEVLEFCKETGDTRWKCNALIVRSRLNRFRKIADEAEALAQQALEVATDTHQHVQIFDAYIARGEARMEAKDSSPEKIKQAMQDFESALGIVGDNPKSYGVCHLHMAIACLKQMDLQRAWGHMEEWNSVKCKVQHGLVRDMGTRVLEELTQCCATNLVINTDKTLNYDQHEKHLRTHLMDRAYHAHEGNVKKAAESLGIKRATFYNWRRELRSLI